MYKIYTVSPRAVFTNWGADKSRETTSTTENVILNVFQMQDIILKEVRQSCWQVPERVSTRCPNIVSALR